MRRDPAEFEAIRRVASETIDESTWTDLGGVLSHNVVEFIVRNDSDKTMKISFDGGTTEHLELSAGSKENFTPGSSNLAMEGGIQISAQLLVAGAATAGTNVTVSSLINKKQTL